MKPREGKTAQIWAVLGLFVAVFWLFFHIQQNSTAFRQEKKIQSLKHQVELERSRQLQLQTGIQRELEKFSEEQESVKGLKFYPDSKIARVYVKP